MTYDVIFLVVFPMAMCYDSGIDPDAAKNAVPGHGIRAGNRF